MLSARMVVSAVEITMHYIRNPLQKQMESIF